MAQRYTQVIVNHDFWRTCPNCGKTYLVLHRPTGFSGGWGVDSRDHAVHDAVESGQKVPHGERWSGVPIQRCYHCGWMIDEDVVIVRNEKKGWKMAIIFLLSFFIIFGFFFRLSSNEGHWPSFLGFVLFLMIGIWLAVKGIRKNNKEDYNSQEFRESWLAFWHKEGHQYFDFCRSHRLIPYAPERGL